MGGVDVNRATQTAKHDAVFNFYAPPSYAHPHPRMRTRSRTPARHAHTRTQLL